MGRKQSTHTAVFVRGLETTSGIRNDDPLTFPVFQNGRVQRGNARRRSGMVKIAHFTAPAASMLFDGVNDFVGVPPDIDPTRPDFRSLTQFTMETLFQTTNVASNRTIIGASSSVLSSGVKVVHNTAGAVVTTVEDIPGVIVTITHPGVSVGVKHPYQLKRDGANLTVTISGVALTAVMSATALLKQASPFAIGADGGAALYIGQIDFFRAFRVVKPNVSDGLVRLLQPRKPSVIFDYILDPNANDFVLDRGPLGLHARTTGSPVSASVSLSVNPAPILAIALNRNEDAVQQTYIRVGSDTYPVKL
jgi:hypothetical protein